MEILRNHRGPIAAVLLAAGAFGIAGCANESGKGNDFVVDGEVVQTGQHSVRIEVSKIIFAHGKAIGWFDDGKTHQVHNNYQSCGFANTWHRVGTPYDQNGRVEELDQVIPGEYVEIGGKIRDSYTSCGKYSNYEARPVFDRLQEIAPVR